MTGPDTARAYVISVDDLSTGAIFQTLLTADAPSADRRPVPFIRGFHQSVIPSDQKDCSSSGSAIRHGLRGFTLTAGSIRFADAAGCG